MDTYNVFGETTQTRRELPNNSGWLVSETVYDSQGRVVFSTDSHLEGSSDPVYGTKSLYDSQGRSVGSIRYVGCKITIAADGSSSVSVTGSEVYRTSTEYDTKGRAKSSTDAYGNTTTYEYDSLDRQTIVKQASGLITETVYNAKGQVEKSIIRFGNEERVTSYKYDEFGNINETTQPDGTKISAKYNEKGQKVSETNQLGQTRSFEYDDNGQLIKVTLPEANGQKPVYEYTYDAQGNQLTIKDPNGHITRFVYDINGNQTERILPDANSTETFEYDPRGQLISQTSFEGIITTYQYDKYDRLESKTFKTAAGETETWTYIYDEYGRVKEIHQGDRITYTKYNEQGQVEYIETFEGRVSYTYDEFGRQTSVKTDNDEPISYTYDNYGRLKTVKYDNQTTTYEYDTFGNLVKTTTKKDSERLITTYKYDNMNRLITLTNFVDVNEDGILNAGDNRISQFDYRLDLLGRKEYATEWFGNGDSQKNKIDWTYDNAGRLIREVFDHYDDTLDQTQEWEYDLIGNRTLQKLDKGNDGFVDARTTYMYDVNDRLLEEILDDLTAANKDRTTIYGYNHTQQTYKSVSENGVKLNETTFAYDAQGRMSVVTITTFAEDGITITRNERTSYEYGADGIRVSALHEIDAGGNGEYETSKLTEYLNDPLNITGYSQVLKQVETDLTTGDETVTTYVIGHQRISQITVTNGTEQEYYFTFDGHGSTRVLINFAEAVREIYSFDAYGNALGFDPATALTEFLYSGEQFDSKIGQQYLRARYYDPATGRFNRLDPFFGNLNDPQSFHKYLYTHADPTNDIDPTGETLIGMVGGFLSSSFARISSSASSMAAMKFMSYNIGRAIIGASVGGLIGFGDGMLAKDRTVGSVLMNTLLGAASGAIFGAIAPFARIGYWIAFVATTTIHGVVDSIQNENNPQAAYRFFTGLLLGYFLYRNSLINLKNPVLNSEAIAGKNAYEIAELYQKAGYNAVVRQSTKGSQKAFLIDISKGSNVKAPTISTIEVHPGGGTAHPEAGPYIRFSGQPQPLGMSGKFYSKVKLIDSSQPYIMRGERSMYYFYTGSQNGVIHLYDIDNKAFDEH